MELSDACMLSEGEEIILDDGNIGRNKKLVLTNKRLIFLQGKGRFNRTYHKEDEIPIENIESAYYDTEFGAVVLQLKNGEKELIEFGGLDSFDVLMGTDADILEVRLQATIDRWVNAINMNIKHKPMQIRCSYCRQIYDETLVNCPRCGASR